MTEQEYTFLNAKLNKLFQENEMSKDAYEHQKDVIKSEYESVRKVYDEGLQKDLPSILKRKYLHEKDFYFEQQILQVDYNVDAELEECKLYGQRLKSIFDHLQAKQEKALSPSKCMLYDVNRVVISESMHYYNSKINYIKQTKIVNMKLKIYIDFLRDYQKHLVNPYEVEKIDKDIEKYQALLLTPDKEDNLDENLSVLEQEKNILIQTFKNQRFQIKEDEILSLKIADKNIMNVVYMLYPGCKKEIDGLKEENMEMVA